MRICLKLVIRKKFRRKKDMKGKRVVMAPLAARTENISLSSVQLWEFSAQQFYPASGGGEDTYILCRAIQHTTCVK
jgi:hypothetical protein